MEIKDLYSVELHQKGAEMQLVDQLGNNLDMWITLQGVDSLAIARATSDRNRTLVKAADDENLDQVEIETLAKALSEITVGWRGFEADGEELMFTKEVAYQLYLNAPYLVKQANAFTAVRANFIKG